MENWKTCVLVALLVCAQLTSATIQPSIDLKDPSLFHFASLGDWGCVPIGGFYTADQYYMARQISSNCEQVNARFILNTGDNFYYCGIKEGVTDPMWNTTFENVYSQQSFMVPWYGCLGNHDYGYPGSAEAQIQYQSPNNNRWQIPDRYYYKRMIYPGEVNISLVVLDATPCEHHFVDDIPEYWDPCGSVIPGCPGCTFHENVIKQNCSAQLQWLENVLSWIPEGDWKIALTHAPAANFNVNDLLAPLQAHGFHLYVNGHVHLMAHYTMDNKGAYVTTGAACYIRVPNVTAVKQTTDQRILAPEAPAPTTWWDSSCPQNETSGHSCQIVYEEIIAGYTMHTFSADFNTLYTSIYDYEGRLLHLVETPKNSTL